MSKNKRAKQSATTLIDKTKRLLEEKGTEPLKTAKKMVSEEKVVSGKLHEALQYFMNQYWHDLTTPTLISLACEAVGGNASTVKPIAVPMILISGAIDIHDDVIDKSKEKDGKATVFGKFGKETALIAGDFLLVEGFTSLTNALKTVSCEKHKQIVTIVRRSLFELAEAESLELSLKAKGLSKPDEHLSVIHKKAADVEGLMMIGAVLGEGSSREVAALGKYGRCLGMLSILKDELLDTIDEKEFSHRIRYESLPITVLYTFQNMASNSKELFLSSLQEKNAKELCKMIEKHGGFVRCREAMRETANECYAAIKSIKYNKKELILLIDYLTFT